eukprot:881917-Rhodomonas_salina.2
MIFEEGEDGLARGDVRTGSDVVQPPEEPELKRSPRLLRASPRRCYTLLCKGPILSHTYAPQNTICIRPGQAWYLSYGAAMPHTLAERQNLLVPRQVTRRT